MSLAGNALEFIRKNISDDNQYVLPIIPSIATGSAIGSFGNYGIDFLNTGVAAGINEYLRIESDLVSRYVDYENMDDNSPIISSGYDIYSDDSCQTDSMRNRSVWIEAEDEDVRRSLDDLFSKTLRIEERIWEMSRVLVKYGNQASELVVRQGKGVVGLNLIPPPTFRRIDIPPSRDSSAYTGFIYDPTGVFRIGTREFTERLNQRVQDGGEAMYSTYLAQPNTIVYEDWEIVHMRLTGKKPGSQYGYGIADGVRWLFKRLEMLEDSIVLHRLTRSPSRFAIYVDVSNIAPNEVNAYLNQVKQAMSKQKYINPQTGKIDQRFDVTSTLDNFYLPVREGRESTRVESLSGPVYDYIEDIKFFEAKIFAGLKIPRAFLSYEESTAKTNLSAEDSRFARTILRIQRELKNGLHKVGRVHLAARGIRPELVNFDVMMTVPSAIFELAQMEIKNAELELAEKFEAYAPREWIMKHILGFSDDQIYEMDEMRRREIEASEGGDEMPRRSEPGGDASISLESRRPAKKISSDEFWTGGKKSNLKNLEEKLDKLKTSDVKFKQKFERIEGLLTDLRANLRSK